jgi:hypothetical protein
MAGYWAYVSAGSAGLLVVDLTDPYMAHIEGSVSIPVSAEMSAIQGPYAYVAAATAGLQVVDISDPALPHVVGGARTPYMAYGVAVDGLTAYVADTKYGLQIFDVSDPANPLLLGGLDTPGTAYNVALAPNYALVADDAGGVQVLPLSCGSGTAAPEFAGPNRHAPLSVVPNPTRGEASIRFSMLESIDGGSCGTAAWLSLYDAGGRLVRRLAAGPLIAGSNLVQWDGRNETGERVPTGIYLARVVSGSRVATGQVVLLR